MERRGKYIVIEGPDSVGKTTQLLELAERMRAAGLAVRTISDPDSELDKTAQAIGQLAESTKYPKNARSKLLLNSAARSQLLKTIQKELDRGVHCLVERNYLTTLTRQFYGHGDVPDYYAINDIASFASGGLKSDLTIVLDAPVLTLKRRAKNRLKNQDEAFLERVRAGYLWEAKQRNYPVIYASKSVKTVANDIWQLASRVLVARPDNAATSVKSIIDTRNNQQQVTAAQVESAQAQLPALDVSDLMLTKLGKNLSSVKQKLNSVDFTQKDERGHYKYYLPQEFKAPILKQYTSGLDQIFGFYAEMAGVLTKYIREHDKTPKKQRDSAWRSSTSAKARLVLQPVLPVATKTNAVIFTANDGQNSFFTDLLADSLPEAKATGQKLLTQAGKSSSQIERFKATANKQIKTFELVQKLADKYLPPSHTNVTANGAELTDYTPKNELDLVADMLYKHTDESLDNLKKMVAGWNYDKKVNILKTYLGEPSNHRQIAGPVLEKIYYSWDIICDYGVFRDLQRYAVVDDLEYQALTPRYGYDIPKLIEDAGLTDKYEQCFDTSLKLYSQLQAAGHPLQAQYATLFGHRMRWKATFNASTALRFYELIHQPQDYPGIHGLIKKMHERLANAHPLVTESLDR